MNPIIEAFIDWLDKQKQPPPIMEKLPCEFEKVIHENLWELYERTDDGLDECECNAPRGEQTDFSWSAGDQQTIMDKVLNQHRRW